MSDCDSHLSLKWFFIINCASQQKQLASATFSPSRCFKIKRSASSPTTFGCAIPVNQPASVGFCFSFHPSEPFARQQLKCYSSRKQSATFQSHVYWAICTWWKNTIITVILRKMIITTIHNRVMLSIAKHVNKMISFKPPGPSHASSWCFTNSPSPSLKLWKYLKGKNLPHYYLCEKSLAANEKNRDWFFLSSAGQKVKRWWESLHARFFLCLAVRWEKTWWCLLSIKRARWRKWMWTRSYVGMVCELRNSYEILIFIEQIEHI